MHVAQRGGGDDPVRGVQVIQAHRDRDGEKEVAPGPCKSVVSTLFERDELFGLEPLLIGDDRHRNHLCRLHRGFSHELLGGDHGRAYLILMPFSLKYLIAPG